jgi:hypothetical protein
VDERIDHPVFAVQSSAGVIDLFATEQSGVEEKIENVVFVRGKHEERNWRLGLDLANSGTDSKRSGTRVSPAMISDAKHAGASNPPVCGDSSSS